MTSAMIRPADRTSIALLKLIAATFYGIHNAFRSVNSGGVAGRVVVDGMLATFAATVILMLVALPGAALYEALRDRR